jgi:serine/threonine-protein kinase
VAQGIAGVSLRFSNVSGTMALENGDNAPTVPTDPPPSSESHPVPFGPFWLERRLAVGGSAEVFIARPRLGTLPAPHFVIKRVLNHSERDDAYRMLVHEAELNQAVRHPNVVVVYGAGQVDTEPYLAMEFVEGVDLFRLLRRCEAEQRPLAPGLCVYVARRIARALAAVHTARDNDGHPLDIVHRDVTPSNVYLSKTGDIKLGDFGIARMTAARVRATHQTAGLKGKFGYLSPEQIAGEPFDARADLFALTVVFGEMLIGERLFPGSGQLAVLLAIRDGDIEPLRRRESSLPTELFEICLKGLSREPSARFQSAAELEAALEPFELPEESTLHDELAALVRWASDSTQLAKRLKGQIRKSVDQMRAVREAKASGSLPAVNLPEPEPKSRPLDSSVAGERVTATVRYQSGKTLEGIGFARLVELIATGEIGEHDEVALLGEPLRAVWQIPSLSRYLVPSSTATTSRVFPVGVPDYQIQLSDSSLLEMLARLRIDADTGVLFVERKDPSGAVKRKEIYVREGRLLHVAATDRDELLGEYLIRRGALERGELEYCLEVIGNQGGRLGDTLVSLGLVDALDVFRAIRDLGRDRVAALCSWNQGLVTFYRGILPTHVEFPLDLDLASPMMAGVLVATQGLPHVELPAEERVVVAGPRAPTMASRKERGSVPIALLLAQQLANRGLTVDTCVKEVLAVRLPHGSRTISEREVVAALVVGKILGWIDFQ